MFSEKEIAHLVKDILELSNRPSDENRFRALFDLNIDANIRRSVFEFEQNLNLLLNEFLKVKEWSQRYSEEYLRKRINEILKEIGDSDEKYLSASLALQKLLEEYSTFGDVNIVYIPVQGIELTLPEFEIGQITLCRLPSTFIDSMEERALNLIFGSDLSLVPQTMVESTKKDFEILRTHVVAVFKVNAEPTRAKERAKEELARAFDLMRFSIPAIYSFGTTVLMGLIGEVTSTSRSILVENDSFTNFNWCGERVGALSAFSISSETVAIMDKLGIFVLSKLLKKKISDLNDFQEALLKSIHWFSVSQKLQQENEILNLMTSVEVFFKQQQGLSIAEQLSTAIAFTLGDTVEQRKNLKKEIKEIYGLRSAVSHGGKMDVSQNEIFRCRNMVFVFLQAMIDMNDQFDSRNSLAEHLENLRLSGERLKSKNAKL